MNMSPQASHLYVEAVLTRRVHCLVISGTYALVITGRKLLGQYKGHPIYGVTSMKVLPCNNNLRKATPEEVPLLTLQSILQVGSYFTYYTIFPCVVISLCIITAEKRGGTLLEFAEDPTIDHWALFLI